MNTVLPDPVQQITTADLIAPLCEQQGSSDFEIIDWTVQPINHEKIIATTGGLFHFSGQLKDKTGIHGWSLVMKIINKPTDFALQPEDWCYWKREMHIFASGMLAALPDGVGAPRSYGCVELANGAWVWMEHIAESTKRVWSLDQYQQAARLAGRSAGAYLMGHPLPDYDWFPHFFRSVFSEGEHWPTIMNPESPNSAWNDPLVQQHFAPPLRAQILSIWQEQARFLDVLDELPQVLCHNDFHRRNLMIRQDAAGQDELIAVDWAFTARGALGSDMGGLIATSMFFNEFDPAQAEALEAAVMDGYLNGLADAGWQGDPRLPRLGYLLTASLWMGGTLPGWTVFMQQTWCNEQALYGYPADQLVLKWVTLSEFLMTRTVEARRLIDSLG